jgi:hypothetical protein
MKEVIPKNPFHVEEIRRGQQRGNSKGLLGAIGGLFGQKDNLDETG